MQTHGAYRREAMSALIRAQREAEEHIHQQTCYKRLPDDVLGCLTGAGMTGTEPQNEGSKDIVLTITSRRKRFSFWRSSVRRFPL